MGLATESGRPVRRPDYLQLSARTSGVHRSGGHSHHRTREHERRTYDPAVGRFLSPDPNIQSPTDLQSYNRYSYGLNNPLRYTDPTGYFSVGGALPGIAIALVAVGACTVAPGVGCAVAGFIAAAMNAEVARGEVTCPAFFGPAGSEDPSKRRVSARQSGQRR